MSTHPAIVLMLACTVLATACTRGTPAADYFAELETLSTGLNSELDDLEGVFNAGLLEIDFSAPGSEQQLIDLFRTSITDTAAAFAGLVTGMDSLEPPSGLEAPHADAVRTGQRVLDEYAERSDELAAVASLDDIDNYADAFSAGGIRQRFTESCRELQAIADAERVVVDLSCS